MTSSHARISFKSVLNVKMMNDKFREISAGGWKAGGRYRIEFYNFEFMEFFTEFVSYRAHTNEQFINIYNTASFIM